jgi:hypothetical protein
MAKAMRQRRGRGRKLKASTEAQTVKQSSQDDDRDSLEWRIVSLATRGKLKAAANNAVESQRAAGLPIVYQTRNRIVRQHPDGTEETLRTVSHSFRPVPEKFQSIVVRRSGKRRK